MNMNKVTLFIFFLKLVKSLGLLLSVDSSTVIESSLSYCSCCRVFISIYMYCIQLQKSYVKTKNEFKQ